MSQDFDDGHEPRSVKTSEKLRLLVNGRDYDADLEQCRTPGVPRTPRTPRTPGLDHFPRPTSQRWIWIGLVLALLANSGCLFLSYTLYLKSLTDFDSIGTASLWAPDLATIGGYGIVTLNNSEHLTSKWIGTPNPTLDAAWDRSWRVPKGRMTRDELVRVHKDPDMVAKWPATFGGGYVFGGEVFHHLHCLDVLRMATWRPQGYYGEHALFAKPEEEVRAHMDHCIDTLRQTLMCYGDTSPKTFVWVDGYEKPQPDDVVTKKCRNFDAVLAWGHSRAMPEAAADALDRSDAANVWAWPP